MSSESDILTYYKSIRFINGKLKSIITDEYDSIIENPTKEQMQIAIPEDISSYRKNRSKQRMEGRKCCTCKSDKTYISESGYHQWHSCECGNQNCSKYLCHACRMRLEHSGEWRKRGIGHPVNVLCHMCEKDKSSGNWCRYYDKNGDWNGVSYICSACYATIHRDSDWKKGNLDPLSSAGKGFIGQQVVAKRYDVEDCNLLMNNFRFYVDISKIVGYGYCEVKTRSFDILKDKYEQWLFDTRRKQEYDTLILLCMDRNIPWTNVERVYAIPWEVVVSRNKANITISRNSLRKGYWYEEFRIDEKPFDDIYHNMKLENCDILRKNKAMI